MMVELPAYNNQDEGPYDILVNLQRVMWAAPMNSGETPSRPFTRLYMNVADSRGDGPCFIDIDLTYVEFRKKVKLYKQEKHHDTRQSEGHGTDD